MKPFVVVIFLQQLLLLTLNLLWFQSCRAASSLGNETDHLALLKFKDSISNDPHNVLASWNGSTHFCSWHGITCSRRHQRVKELNLDGYDLHGFVSPHIGNLSFLRSISLQNNSFNGEIPQELGRLFRLQLLALDNNILEGEFPINVTSCFELRYLSFYGNKLTGKIPMEIGSLQKLELLYLSINNLTGQIPTSMWNLSSLRFVYMPFNNLEGSIPEEIGRLRNLVDFAVGVNKFSGTLPSSLYNLSSLSDLEFTDNQFNSSLPTNMFLTLPNLQYLVFGGNQISGPIPTSITNASGLVDLEFSYNNFVGQVPCLEKLQDLSTLLLSTNSLGSNSAKDWEFLKCLINCSKLNIMDVGINNFGGPLPSIIGNLSTQLSQLFLSGNQIFGKIPTALGNLNNLILLAVDSNYFSENIPTTFGKFPKMQELFLEENKLSGEIPPILGNLSRLSKLNLSQNMLEGHIPASIGNCQSLQYLDLSQNNLTGVIPIKVISLSSLSILLNLSHNTLSGTLPIEVGKLTNINKLDVSENYLFGDIPGTIGECKSLEYLYLQGNSFDGTIPLSLATLKGLRHLDLSRNKLSGSIPKSLQNSSALEYLNISFNMLDGEVPKNGVFGNASMISINGNSKLCGGILELRLPPCSIKVVKTGKHHNLRMIVVICSTVAFLLLLSLIVGIYQVRKRNKNNSPTTNQLPKVTYRSLHNATNGFSVNNLIGSGSFGSVFRGSIESEEVVAIKVLKLQTEGAVKSFMAECNALRNIRHRNLVKILTCCSSIDYKGHEFKALVFEYMTNGSLEKWLHPCVENANHPRNFFLDQRLNIIIDVGFALHYLHHECEQPVIHSDLKPSNILLDGDMVAHVSDFGLARLLSPSKGFPNNQTSTVGIKGTIGYTPPEYGMGAEVSIQGDMYSFGILVLEILTGKRPTEDMFKDGHYLHNHVEIAFTNNKLLEIVDPAILPRESEQEVAEAEQIVVEARGQWENLTLVHPNVEKCLFSLFRIGLACSEESAKERMSMMDVTRELNLIRNAYLYGGMRRH